MVYLDLFKITPPDPPNDLFVNEVTQLNNNWDLIDIKLANMQGVGGGADNPEVGQEFISGGKFSVWDGTALRMATQYFAAWTSWTPLPLVGGTNFIARPGFPPQWRVNTELRKGELTGGLLYDAAASTWPAGTINTVSSSTPGTLTSYPPIHTSYYQLATSAVTSSSGIAGARGILDTTNGWRLRVQFLGTFGGGNFVMLDRISWWY